MPCNGLIEPVAKADVLERLEPKTKQYYDTFFRCTGCGAYWEGSHVARTRARLSSSRNEASAKLGSSVSLTAALIEAEGDDQNALEGQSVVEAPRQRWISVSSRPTTTSENT